MCLSVFGYYLYECEFIFKMNVDDEDVGYFAYVEYDVSRDVVNVVVFDV